MFMKLTTGLTGEKGLPGLPGARVSVESSQSIFILADMDSGSCYCLFFDAVTIIIKQVASNKLSLLLRIQK
jgi:hypothetical protein